MKNGLVIADAGPIFPLAIISKLQLLNSLFDEIKIPRAVWKEITLHKHVPYFKKIRSFFKDKISDISGFNELIFLLDYGESESIILYKELQANFLLIDDKKARKIAENLGINCIGTLGLLATAKDKGLVDNLKPIFELFLKNKRYYSIDLLNGILIEKNEQPLNF